MRLCKNCIEEIKSRGEIVYVGPQVFSIDDVDYGEEEEKCDWCEEVDDLYDCK